MTQPSRIEERADVYWNNSDEPIFVTIGIEADPMGGPGHGRMTYLVGSGEAIDLSILGMSRIRALRDREGG